MELKINLITKDTDISSLEMEHMNWDVVIRDRPYYVVWIDGYCHSIYGRYGGGNCYWAYPRDESPSFENLIEFSNVDPVQWGISYNPKLYIHSKWDESEICQSKSVTITRNGQPFYIMMATGIAYGIDSARCIITTISEHPLNLNQIDYDINMVGRKVWWKDEPAIIERFIGGGQAAVMLIPDGVPCFKSGETDIKDDIFSKDINWFRD